MSVLGPTLETARLTLRPTAPADFEPWAELAGDELVMKFLGGPLPRSVAWRNFLAAAGAWAMQGFGQFSVIERSSGRWVGRVGPLLPEGWPGTEVGWALAREAWGRGYATEAASAAMDFAVDALGWSEVIHCIDDGNLTSQSVARRLGSSVLRIGRLPAPIDEDITVWGQSAAQWKARRG